MPIPAFREDGWLPVGHHAASWNDITGRLGGPADGQRGALIKMLLNWRDALRNYGVSGLLILDGSFVSAKGAPDDIDAIFVCDVVSIEIFATNEDAARLVSYVWMKQNGFGDYSSSPRRRPRTFLAFADSTASIWIHELA